MSTETYAPLKIGDHVIEYSYWNESPGTEGTVIAFSDHFVKVVYENGFFNPTKWLSRAKIEVVTEE